MKRNQRIPTEITENTNSEDSDWTEEEKKRNKRSSGLVRGGSFRSKNKIIHKVFTRKPSSVFIRVFEVQQRADKKTKIGIKENWSNTTSYNHVNKKDPHCRRWGFCSRGSSPAPPSTMWWRYFLAFGNLVGVHESVDSIIPQCFIEVGSEAIAGVFSPEILRTHISPIGKRKMQQPLPHHVQS